MLYRVIVRTTSNLQPESEGGTHWVNNVVYCGGDVDEARRLFHENSPDDIFLGYGSRSRETVFGRLDTDLLDDDEPGEMIECEADDD